MTPEERQKKFNLEASNLTEEQKQELLKLWNSSTEPIVIKDLHTKGEVSHDWYLNARDDAEEASARANQYIKDLGRYPSGLFTATVRSYQFKPSTISKKVLIIGHMRQGKDTVAEMISDEFGLTHKSSSMAAAEIFIYDQLKESHGYKTFEECYEDRMNHRALWHDLICEYNKEDKARLAKSILEDCDMYVGMRSNEEIEACLEQGLFDYVIGVFDPRKPLEGSDSFNIDIWSKCDFVIPNSGTLEDLRNRVKKLPL